MACSVGKVPWAPGMPWQMTLVLESTSTDMCSGRSLDGGDDLFRRVRQIVGGYDVQAAGIEDVFALLDVGAFQADHQGHRQADVLHRGDDALGDDVAAHDAAEDV